MSCCARRIAVIIMAVPLKAIAKISLFQKSRYLVMGEAEYIKKPMTPLMLVALQLYKFLVSDY